MKLYVTSASMLIFVKFRLSKSYSVRRIKQAVLLWKEHKDLFKRSAALIFKEKVLLVPAV